LRRGRFAALLRRTERVDALLVLSP